MKFNVIDPPRLLTDESPLHKLPVNLIPEQRLLFEGIRYSVEMADIAYTRLHNALIQISLSSISKLSTEEVQPDLASIFLDAWSFVDSLSRLRRLFCKVDSNGMPNLVTEFCDNTEDLRLIRNRIQHMDERMSGLIDLKEPVWGYLTWISHFQFPQFGVDDHFMNHILSPGSVQSVELYFENPAGQVLGGDISLLKLRAYGLCIPINEIFTSLAKAIGYMEGCFRDQWVGTKNAPSDVYIRVEITPVDNTND